MQISSNDLFSIVGWLVLLFLGYRYVNRRRHPSRAPVKAFLVFIGIFGGIVLAGLFVFLMFTYSFDEASQPVIVRSLSKVLLLAVVIPAWKFAVSRVSSEPYLMNKITAISLQLAEGLFGWTWLLSAVVAFWFFISIFISNGTWSRFFAAAIVAFVSKRLLRFFMNVRRAVYSSASVGDTKVESLVQELQNLPPRERELWTNHLEALAAVNESTELHAKIMERAHPTLGLLKGWLNLELVSETFATLQAGGMDMDAVARLNCVVMTQAELMQGFIVQWRKLNPEAEDHMIDTLKRACDVVLTSTGYSMKILIARRRRELNPKAVPSPEDAEILARWDRIVIERDGQRVSESVEKFVT